MMLSKVVFIGFISATLAFHLPTTSTRHSTRFTEMQIKKGKDNKEKDMMKTLATIIFPNIYTEYEDVTDGPAMKTKKIQSKMAQAEIKERTQERFSKEEAKSFGGRYNSMDERTVPKEVSMTNQKSAELKKIAKPANFVAPTPRKAIISNARNIGATVIEGRFAKVRKPIIIYEDESSAECKRVREAISHLDLLAEFRPCPNGRNGWSDDQARISNGKRGLPYMVDTNAPYQFKLKGAKEIVPYLWESYGPGESEAPAALTKSGGGGGGSLASKARPDFQKVKPIVLYGFEGSSNVAKVKKTLNSLALAHQFVPCAKGSPNRKKPVFSKTFQVPFISDPNTGVSMFESAEIVNYLNEVYTK